MRRGLLPALLSLAIMSGLSSRVPAANLPLQIATAPRRDPPHLGKLELFARPRNAPDPEARFADRVADHTEIVLRLQPNDGYRLLEARFCRLRKGWWRTRETVRPKVSADGSQEAVCRWDTEHETNKPKRIRVLALITYRDHEFWWVQREAVWQPFNTVLKASFDLVLKHIPGDARHEIAWEITHLRDRKLGIDPRYRVEVQITPIKGGAPVDTLVLHQVRLGRSVVSWQPTPERVARSRGYPPVALVKPQDTEGLYTYRVTVSACCRDTWPLLTGGDILAQYFMPVDGDAEHIDMFVRYKLERDYINGQIEFFRTIDGQYVQVGAVALKGDQLRKGVHWAPTARIRGTAQDMPWTVITGTGY